MHIEKIGDATLYLGDAREVLPGLPRDTAIVSDPPYGMGYNTDGSRFTKGGRSLPPVRGDDRAFDPRPWLQFKETVLFGGNHFASLLPIGTLLVWIKKTDAGFGTFLSDAEVAWLNRGHGVYCRRDRSMQNADRSHPTEKPVGIMEWCLSFVRSNTIADPFMGSGTTGVACMQLGRRFIGVEIEPRYFDIACRRIEAAQAEAKIPA